MKNLEIIDKKINYTNEIINKIINYVSKQEGKILYKCWITCIERGDKEIDKVFYLTPQGFTVTRLSAIH